MKEGVQILNYKWALCSVNGLWYEGPKVEAPSDREAFKAFINVLNKEICKVLPSNGFECVRSMHHSIYPDDKEPRYSITLDLKCGIIEAEATYWPIRMYEI